MFEECLYFNLNSLTRDINRLWEGEFAKVGLTPAQGYFLALVIEKPGLLQKEIGRSLNLERSTVTRLIDGMITKGLIRKEGDAMDARASQIFPTKKGEKLSDGIQHAMGSLMQWAKENLDVKKAEKLLSDIRDLQKQMKHK